MGEQQQDLLSISLSHPGKEEGGPSTEFMRGSKPGLPERDIRTGVGQKETRATFDDDKKD